MQSLRPLLLLAFLPLLACGADDPVPREPAPRREAPAPEPGPPPAGEPTPPTPPASAQRRIAFVDSLEAASAAAPDEDALLFVYVGRHHPT